VRLPESALRAAILHPEEEVRLAAVTYFSGAMSRDETIMPAVIQAVERHGRDRAFRMLRSAERLAQTPATVDWLLGELRRPYALHEIDEDNYRFAVALILCRAPAALLRERRGDMAALPMFPEQLRAHLDQRLEMLSWDWERAWIALEALGRRTMRSGRFTRSDVLHAELLVESLARHRAEQAGTVLKLLEGPYEPGKEALIEWLKPLVARLAGAMRLASAVPLLTEYLPHANVSLADESTTALIRIGAGTAVAAIADRWPDAGPDFRAAACDVLEHIHSDLCTEACLRFFAAEEHPAIRLSLAHAVLSQFVEEGVEPVRRLVLGPEEGLAPDYLDIRYRLVAACLVMGAAFPELDRWHDEAVANRWGLGDYRPPRLAESSRPE